MNGTALALCVSLGLPAPAAVARSSALVHAAAPSYEEYEAKLIQADASATIAREADLSTVEAQESYARAVTLFVGAYAALPPADRSSELGGDIVTLTHGLLNSQRVGAALWRMDTADAERWLPVFDAAIALHKQHLESAASPDSPRTAMHRSGLQDLEAAKARLEQTAAPGPMDPVPEPVVAEEVPEPAPPPVEVSDDKVQDDKPAPARRGLVIGLAAGGGALVAAGVGTLVGGLNIRKSRDDAETAYGREGLLEEPEVIEFLDAESARARGLFIATGVLAGVGVAAIVAAIVVKQRASKQQASVRTPRFAGTSGGFQLRF